MLIRLKDLVLKVKGLDDHSLFVIHFFREVFKSHIPIDHTADGGSSVSNDVDVDVLLAFLLESFEIGSGCSKGGQLVVLNVRTAFLAVIAYVLRIDSVAGFADYMTARRKFQDIIGARKPLAA